MINQNPKDWVVILGSGNSINYLPKNLINWINRCDARIAINKFGYFYDETEIVPTDLYFHDYKNKTAFYFLKASIKKLSSQKNIKFYISDELKNKVIRSKVKFNSRIFTNKTISIITSILRKTLKPFSRKLFDNLNGTLAKKVKRNPLYFSKDKIIRYVEIKELFDVENKWGESYDQPLFHFRGSLTTVFNTISIEYPNHNVLMVGVDMNNSRYFFDKQLAKISSKADFGKDWTSIHMEDHGKHFSAIEMEGVTMFDRMQYCVDKLKDSNNYLYAYPMENASIFKDAVTVFKV
ncbi:hypothetical protein JCM19298_1870 [Nonlabens ulvanivorans]|nr:hypothetical protein [Nonlabens ulvanivorans]GAK93151.1 hypothetical protein JCM19298_1870 [Nonlabens ulvanivorans]